MTAGREVLKNSSYLLAARLFVRLASLPFMLYMAATLKPRLFGMFAFVIVTIEILSSLGDVGLTRYGARAVIRGEMRKERLAGIFLSIQITTSVVLMAIAYMVLLIIAPEETKMRLFMIAFIALFLSSFIYTTETIFTAEKRFGASAVFQVLGKVVYLALGFIFLALGYSVLAVMTAYIVAMAVESMLRMIYMRRRITPLAGDYTVSEVKDVAMGTLPFAVSGMAVLLYYRADTIILGLIKSDFEVGIYSAAYSFFTFFFWIPVIISRTLLPGLIERYKHDPEASLATSVAWFRDMTLLGVAIAFAVTVAARTIFELLMPIEQYGDSIRVLQIIIWSIPFLMMVSVSLNTMIMAGLEKVAASAAVITTVAIILLDFALIPGYGVNGAATAMVVATSLWALQLLWLTSRRAWKDQAGPVRLFLAPLTALAGSVAAGVLLYPLSPYAALVAGLTVCAMVGLYSQRRLGRVMP